MRLIDADSLSDVCTRLNEDGWGITHGEFKLMDRVLFEFPNAQRKGEWRSIVLTSYPAKYREMCSCCGFMKNKEAFKFCSICGADMRPDNAPLADDDNIYG